MKILSKISAVLLSICLCLGSSITSYATNETTETCNTSVETTEKVVLYEDENILVYQSKKADYASDSSNQLLATRENNYGNAWVNSYSTGSFPVHNTHTSGQVGVTWKVESSSNDSYAQMYMTTKSGQVVLQTRAVHPSDGDVRFVIKQGNPDYVVHYIAVTNVGMRIMCWTY